MLISVGNQSRYADVTPEVQAMAKVLLVTSALHMPRALAVFKAAFAGAGVTFVPAATDAEALGDLLASKPSRNAAGVK